MRIPKISILFVLIGLVACSENHDDPDSSAVFMEEVQALFANNGGFQNLASKFMESDAGKQVGNMLTGNGKNSGGGIGDVLEGVGNLLGAMSGNKDPQSRQGGDMNLPMLGSILGMIATASGAGNKQRSKTHVEGDASSTSGGFDLEGMLNIASMFAGQGGNAEGLMGLLPMFLDGFSGGDSKANGEAKKQDHSSHSWYMPPFLENLHVMWDHFSHSELGQTLWRKSGLENIVSTMLNENGQLKYEQMLDSFENPTQRRKWIRSLTNYVADWIAYVADPATRQRHINTVQFVGNSFLKSQGYPKTAMFDASKPVESLTRIVNAGAKRHLNMQIDSHQYIKPAIAYIQDLMRLASEKGFIMSRVNANELSNRLSDTINNDFISPLLKTYRAYKWAIKSPKCAKHVLCTINQQSNEIEDDSKLSQMRSTLTRLASYPAAFTISMKTGESLWSLYSAIQESDRCFEKYPADCAEFHEEEIRVTTESAHSEL